MSKFKLIENKNNLDKEALKDLGKKHTAKIAVVSLLSGVTTLLAGKYITNKKTLPFAEKKYDNCYEFVK